jgi:hypothetical protein
MLLCPTRCEQIQRERGWRRREGREGRRKRKRRRRRKRRQLGWEAPPWPTS